jgi:NitT/TauT family transport system ATP-binding protein
VLVFSSRPGRVREDVRIDLPVPRDPHVKRTTEFQEHVERLAELLEEPPA